MESAQDTISDALFPETEKEEVEEVEIIEEVIEEVEEVAEKEEKPEDLDEALKEEIQKANAPQSWKKEMHEFYNSADPVLQKYINDRETQMHDGLEKDRNDANLGRTMRDMMTPYDEMFKSRGIEAPQVVQHLLQNHQRLSSGTNEQKVALLRQLAQSYGITGPEKGGETNPQIQSLTDRLQAMESNMNASHQRSVQESRTRINTEVSTFAESHPLFDDLSDEIAKYIRAGDSLEDAYSKAERLSDGYQQKEIDKLVKEQLASLDKEAKKEAEAAKKAQSVNIKSRDTRKSPTAKKGKMFDDMSDIYQEIKSR